MHTYTLAHVSDAALLDELAALVATDRQTTAALLAHIGEVDARGLFLPAACASMHVYCVRVLHLAEEVAFKRIRVARIARRFPQIFDAIADGRLHVSGVAMLAPHVTEDNVDELIAAATHRSKTEIEVLIARLAPKPDVPTSIRRVESQEELREPLPLDPDPVAPPPADTPPDRVKPLAPERFEVRVTISQATRDKIERATALLRHRNPSGDLAEVLDRALDALLEKLEKEKFGVTSRPRAKKARSESADPHYVTNADRRAVHARDGEQCSFVSETGERCTERGFLEIDHRDPVCLGGGSTASEVRMLCRAHNQYEAERVLGADFMRAKREAAATVRAQSPTQSDRGDEIDARPKSDDPRRFDADTARALRSMGFKATEVSRAMANTEDVPAATLEARLRAALADLGRAQKSRCSESPFGQAEPCYAPRLWALGSFDHGWASTTSDDSRRVG